MRTLGQAILLLRLMFILLARVIGRRASTRGHGSQSEEEQLRSSREAGGSLRNARKVLVRAAAPAGRFVRRQWPALICLVLALGFTIVTLAIRLYDGRTATVEDYQLDRQKIGVFTDGRSIVSLTPVPEHALVEAGGQVPESRWSVELKPGQVAHGRIILVILGGGGLWHVDVTAPIQVTMQLPVGAELEASNRMIRAGSEGTCASWYTGKSVQYARPRLERSVLGDVAVTCIIPAVGRVGNLFFEVDFRWPDHTWDTVGFGRHTAWVRFAPNEQFASDIQLPGIERRLDRILVPVELQLDLDESDKLTETFPEPSGGGLAQRKWLIERGIGGDVQYTIERAQDRAWVQPMTELSLMLAGVAFGLLPSLWRRKPSLART